MTRYTTVDAYIEGHLKWHQQLKELRNILMNFPLKETIKWGSPVYVYKEKNLIGMVAFKNHYSLWFFEGVLLSQNKELLINAQEGKTKSLRQIKFDENSEIQADVLSEYIKESIDIARSGVKLPPTPPKKVEIPSELSERMKEDPNLEKAFSELSLARLREYCDYITEAKKKVTKHKRIEKITPFIKSGKGLNDGYKPKRSE